MRLPKLTVVLLVAVLLLGLVNSYVLFGGSKQRAFSGVVYEKTWFNGPVDLANTVNSLVSGAESPLINATGSWVGPINTANSAVFTGTSTLSGAFIPNSIGSGVLVLSNTTSTTFTAAQVCANNVIRQNPQVLATTTTLPTAVALQAACLNAVGGSRTILVQNNGSATSSIGFLAGASSTIFVANGGTATTTIPQNKIGELKFFSITTDTTTSTMVGVSLHILE